MKTLYVQCEICGEFVISTEVQNHRHGANPIKSPSSPLTTQVGGSHYKNLPIQPVEFCQRNKLNFCESSAIKYITRHREKNGREDILKAIHFLQLLLEIEYDNTVQQSITSVPLGANPKTTPQ